MKFRQGACTQRQDQRGESQAARWQGRRTGEVEAAPVDATGRGDGGEGTASLVGTWIMRSGEFKLRGHSRSWLCVCVPSRNSRARLQCSLRACSRQPAIRIADRTWPEANIFSRYISHISVHKMCRMDQARFLLFRMKANKRMDRDGTTLVLDCLWVSPPN